MESSSKRRTLMPLTTSMWAYTRCGYVAGSSVRWGGSRTKNRSPHKACFNQQSLFATQISIKWEIRVNCAEQIRDIFWHWKKC